MKDLSYITETFTESVIREMTRICDEVGGYNLSQGFPDFPAPSGIKKAAIRAIEEEYNQYPVTFGEPILREKISQKVKRFNNIECSPKDMITVTCGATEAMIASLKAILNPSDEIIIFEPYYENYGPDGILSGAIPRYVTLNPPYWTYNYEELASAFNEKTKAIIINTPNNPTGKVFSRKELQEIADLCIKWDVYAITDEIYEHITYDGAKHISIASLKGMADRSITINSISKTYSVTGWRVGWAIANPVTTQRIRKVHDFLTVGAPTPFQIAAAEALDFDDDYYDKLSSHYAMARDFLYDVLKKVGFNVEKPQGAYYFFVKYGKVAQQIGGKDDFDFCQRLIETSKVATVPGSSFFSEKEKGSDFVRFCFCKKWETLEAVKKEFQKLIV